MTIYSAQSYQPDFRYLFLAIGGGVIAALFVANLLRSTDQALLGGLFFLSVSLAIAGWALWLFGSRVHVDDQSLDLHRPFAGATTVRFGQLIDVSEGGRLGSSITLLYHPLRADGQIDLEDAATLHLPTVRNQEVLLDLLREKMPA